MRLLENSNECESKILDQAKNGTPEVGLRVDVKCPSTVSSYVNGFLVKVN
jgi:hypothetical protein